MALAQHSSFKRVRGENYQVANRADGLEVLWDGEPAKAEQLVRADQQMEVLDPATGEARLLILLAADGTFTDVVDLKYSDLESYRAQQARDRAYAERDRRRRERDRARREKGQHE